MNHADILKEVKKDIFYKDMVARLDIYLKEKGHDGAGINPDVFIQKAISLTEKATLKKVEEIFNERMNGLLLSSKEYKALYETKQQIKKEISVVDDE